MPTIPEEKELVERMIEGDEAAFDTFSEGYIPQLYRFALRRLDGNADLSRDVVQATLCKVLPKLATWRGDAALMTWLCACCRNEIAAHFRSQGKGGNPVDFDDVDESTLTPLWQVPDGPDREFLRKESSRLVHVVLDSLPPHYGQALEWKYLQELPVKEIAARLEVGPKAAESLLTRARLAFRDGYERLSACLEASAQDSPPTRQTLEYGS